jgi:hypothetical protein
MDDGRTQIAIDLQVDEDISPQDLDELTAAMRRELLNLDVDSVDRVSAGPPPAGAKGVELAQLGALIVSLGQATPVLGQIVEVVRAWTSRGSSRTVKLTLEGDTLEVGGMSEDAQRKVINDWMARHAKPRARRPAAT